MRFAFQDGDERGQISEGRDFGTGKMAKRMEVNSVEAITNPLYEELETSGCTSRGFGGVVLTTIGVRIMANNTMWLMSEEKSFGRLFAPA